MTSLELLSPARNLECGICAIDHGADAVYIGASKFGARAAAGNSIEDITTLCQYAHQFGAKVYVTVNTVIYDNEMHETVELVRQIEKAGADAILLQDMGLLEELRHNGIGITIHASTQTDNRTADKVRWLASLGMRRVVLARELSVEEIAEIHRAVPEVELEVFVHGALCVSYSGQCYASQLCFNRSANRGECAQFCRMTFDLIDADGKEIERSRHLLSLRDMAQIDNMERLADAGAVSFKIEGRLKNTDYVKNVTAAYSERLNDICKRNPQKFRRASMGRCTYTFTPNIQKSFNRGFTTYFADGRQAPLASIDTPKALGEHVGRVKEIRGNSFNVSSTTAFSNGDGLCFFDKSRQLIGLRVNKAEGNRLYPLSMPKGLLPGTTLYRNHDHAFETLLSKPSSSRRVSIDMTLHITDGSLILDITDEHGHTRTATMPYEPQTAMKPQEENIRKQLAKLGATIYTPRNISIISDVERPFISNSLLSELRRKAVETSPLTSQSVNTRIAETKANSGIHIDNAPLPYLYNAANQKAQAFYDSMGIKATAFETSGKSSTSGNGHTLIMQCRYCIKAELGLCAKRDNNTSGKPSHHTSARWKEPLTLRLVPGGRTFTLRFNCNKCEMEILT